MAIVNKRYIDENGNKVVIFSPKSILVKDVFSNLCDLQSRIIADEYHITLNDKKLVFGPNVTPDELMKMFQNPDYVPPTINPTKRTSISEEYYRALEYDVLPFNKMEWTPTQRLQALHSKLDIALYLHRFDWAKQLAHDIQLIESTL